jgi:hypothetical protein
MGEVFTVDFTTGAALFITLFFAAYSCAAMFKSFKLVADAG